MEVEKPADLPEDKEGQIPAVIHRLKENRIIWQEGEYKPAFWTIASVFSMIVNVILIVILIVMGKELFAIKELVSGQLIGGLHENFVAMDNAVIATTVTVSDTILVDDTIPVQFNLPVQTNTTVILSEDTSIEGATVNIDTPFFTVNNAPANIILPANTELPIALDILVPVDKTVPVVLDVPVNLSVPVEIPLNKTQLHEPFVGLQEVVLPYNQMLSDTPDSWEDLVCGSGSGVLCAMFDKGQ